VKSVTLTIKLLMSLFIILWLTACH